MKDRRVDKGMKYSPIFGRYGFLRGSAEASRTINVGDEAVVSKVNEERTTLGILSRCKRLRTMLTLKQNGLVWELERKYESSVHSVSPKSLTCMIP